VYRDIEVKRARERAKKARLRAEWLAVNGPCKQCGSSENLEVDHIDPSTKVDHNVFGWSAARREAELKKCRVLCRKCHKLKTLINREYGVNAEHGNYAMWAKYKCRCVACVAWKRAANARRKRRRVRP